MSIASLAGLLGSSGTLPTPIIIPIAQQTVNNSGGFSLDYLINGGLTLESNSTYVYYIQLSFNVSNGNSELTQNNLYFQFQNNPPQPAPPPPTYQRFDFGLPETYIIGGNIYQIDHSGIFTMNSSDSTILSYIELGSPLPSLAGATSLTVSGNLYLFKNR
jgi:hypothetical protein